MIDRPRIAVVDHGAGNLVSISQGLERVGAEVALAVRPSDLADVTGVVLPGVGSTGAVMEGIRSAGLDGPLRGLGPIPLLGICVGMQVLFDASEEDGARCLGLIAGSVRRLTSAPTLPHIGWNDLTVSRPTGVLEGLGEPVVYFVHSFAPRPDDKGAITATSRHGEEFVAAVRDGAAEGVQFHPERSGGVGLRMLARFVRRCAEAADAA